LWEVFCNAINRAELLENPAYRDNYDRVKANEEVKAIVEEWSAEKPVKEIVDFLLARKIPCAPIYSVQEVVEDSHIADARRMIREIEHPVAGTVKIIGSPVNMSETPAEVHSPAPLLGQHSATVLRDLLQLDASAIDALREEKAIGP
jgi:formyl-CoA transferase